MSRWMSPKAARGFLKAGDLLVPGNRELPSFSASGLIREADRMLDYVPEGDRSGLLGLAEALAVLPRWAVFLVLWLSSRADRFPDFLGTVLRQVELGLKGFVFTLYYSDPGIRKRLGWDTHVGRKTP